MTDQTEGATLAQWEERRTAPEARFDVPTAELGNAVVYIEKQGGGTVGEVYAGRWNVEIHLDGEVRWFDLETGLPVGHSNAAEIAVEFITADLINERYEA